MKPIRQKNLTHADSYEDNYFHKNRNFPCTIPEAQPS